MPRPLLSRMGITLSAPLPGGVFVLKGRMFADSGAVLLSIPDFYTGVNGTADSLSPGEALLSVSREKRK